MSTIMAVCCLPRLHVAAGSDRWQHWNTASLQQGRRDNRVRNVGWSRTKSDTWQQIRGEDTCRPVRSYTWKLNEDTWQQGSSDTRMRWKNNDGKKRSVECLFRNRTEERKVARNCGTNIDYSVGFCDMRRDFFLREKVICCRKPVLNSNCLNNSNNLNYLVGCRIQKGRVEAGNGEQIGKEADETEKNFSKLEEREKKGQNGKVFDPNDSETLQKIINNGQNRGFRPSKFGEKEGDQAGGKYNASEEEPITTIEIFEKEFDKKEDKEIKIEEKKDAGIIGVPLGRALLLGVTILWGVYGVTLRYIYSQPGPPLPSVLTFVRKVLSVSFFIVLLPFEERAVGAISNKNESANSEKPIENSGDLPKIWWDWLLDPKIWRAGAELGIWSFIGASLQTSGLEYTTATRAGFEVQITNILVPMLAFFFGEEVTFSTWAAALLALGGIVLLGISANGETVAELATADLPTSPDMCTVDVLFAVGAPLILILFIAVLLFHRPLINKPEKSEPLSTAWESWTNGSVLLVVAFSAIGCGAVAALVQTFGQSVVPTAEAQVLYSLTPVWSALFAATLLDERISSLGYLGGGIVLLATLLTTRKVSKENKG